MTVPTYPRPNTATFMCETRPSRATPRRPTLCVTIHRPLVIYDHASMPHPVRQPRRNTSDRYGRPGGRYIGPSPPWRRRPGRPPLSVSGITRVRGRRVPAAATGGPRPGRGRCRCRTPRPRHRRRQSHGGRGTRPRPLGRPLRCDVSAEHQQRRARGRGDGEDTGPRRADDAEPRRQGDDRDDRHARSRGAVTSTSCGPGAPRGWRCPRRRPRRRPRTAPRRCAPGCRPRRTRGRTRTRAARDRPPARRRSTSSTAAPTSLVSLCATRDEAVEPVSRPRPRQRRQPEVPARQEDDRGRPHQAQRRLQLAEGGLTEQGRHQQQVGLVGTEDREEVGHEPARERPVVGEERSCALAERVHAELHEAGHRAGRRPRCPTPAGTTAPSGPRGAGPSPAPRPAPPRRSRRWPVPPRAGAARRPWPASSPGQRAPGARAPGRGARRRCRRTR